MREILINLNTAASLGTLAANPPAAGALPVGMGAFSGVYEIFNSTTDTRYAGITTNLVRRFNGRMATVNEFGFGMADVASVWAWWGNIQTREYPVPAHFAAGFPTMLAGLFPAQQYAFQPGLPASVCPNSTLAAAGVPTPQFAQNAMVDRIRQACAAYHAFTHALLPRNAVSISNAWPTLLTPVWGPVLALIAAAPNAGGAAYAVAVATGMPAFEANITAAAVQAYYNRILPPASDCQAAVRSVLLAAPLPAPPAPTPFVIRNPVLGPPTSITHQFTAGAVVDLEWVFIRFMLQHLTAYLAHVTNLAKTTPLAWPGGADPICVTWRSAAGATLGAFDRSVIWWPNTTF